MADVRDPSVDAAASTSVSTHGPMRFARPALVLFGAVGLVATCRSFDAAELVRIADTVRRMGPGGLLAYCAWSSLVFTLLGGAWLAAAGERSARLALFTWARLVREAVSDFLPFTQIGGIVVSMGVLTSRGLRASTVAASFAVDVCMEMASLVLFATLGAIALWVVSAHDGTAGRLASASIGVACIATLFIGLVRALVRRRPAATTWLLARVRSVSPIVDGATDELVARFADRRAVARSLALNLAAWTASALGAWIALASMGVSWPVGRVVVLESVIFALRAAAFAVPAGLGVQEAGYALVGPLLGLPPEAALALAIAKRARDLAIGLPTLVAWQVAETRGWIGRRRRRV